MQTSRLPSLARLARTALTVAAVTLLACSVSWADDAPAATDEAKPAAEQPTEKEDLEALQKRVSSKYELLEQMLLRNAEFEAIDNPGRAKLLKKAYNLSHNDLGTNQRIKEIVLLLRQKEFSDAIKD
ncbi:MAG: hypothetical protein NXI22_03675, partial [bacterium]|nr:hypothetical protein [bacterium]